MAPATFGGLEGNVIRVKSILPDDPFTASAVFLLVSAIAEDAASTLELELELEALSEEEEEEGAGVLESVVEKCAKSSRKTHSCV